MTDPSDLHYAAERILHGAQPEKCEPPEGWPTIGDEAWHGPAGDIAHAVQEWTEADPIAILVSILTAFGNMVGPGPHTRVGFARHPGRVFACVVGDTAKARKGSSWEAAKSILEGVAGTDRWERRVLSGLSSGEGIIAAVRDPDIGESGEPIPNTGVDDKRLFVLEEEFARVLNVSKREANTVSPIIRAAYDSGNLNVLTKVRQTATGAHISVLGHITEDELRAKLTSSDVSNGFANRFLWVLAYRNSLIYDPEPPPTSRLGPMSASIANALDHANRYQMLELTRTVAAKRLWETLYRQMAADTPGGVVGNLTARPEAHTLRLAVIYALLDCAEQIDACHLAAAWAVWSYSRASVEKIWADPLEGLSTEARKLLDALRAAGSVGLSFTEQSAVFHNHLHQSMLERARLEIDSVIVTVTTPNGKGRPSSRSWASEHGPPGGEVRPIRANKA